MIQHIEIRALLRESPASGFTNLVTRPTGRVVRERIERALGAEDAAPVVRIDFTGVGCIDYSCADEIVAKLAARRAVLVVLRGLADGHFEAIEPVLAGHGRAILLEHPDGSLAAVGYAPAAAALLERLVAERVAGRRPGGTLALITA
ncbi:MAG TPA: hypothetical protein VN848_12640 [Gemmatimonadales bacterium]|nr:hypothetical protein [Gemmatimonadales bacterium]